MSIKIERDRVRSFILEQLLKGDISVGERLSLPYFSKHLNCSVTPIREALTQLEYANIVEVIPNRGFIIPALNQKNAKDVYQLIAALESLALENSSYSSKDIADLKRLIKTFQLAKNKLQRIKADFEFHQRLAQNYDNPLVHQKIRDLRIRIFTYENQFMENMKLVEGSDILHKKIVQAISNNQMKRASKLLQQNWEVMLEFIQNKF